MYETLFVFGLDKFIKTYQAFRLRCLPRSPLLQFFDLRGLQKPRRCGAPNGFRSALGCEGLDRGGRCEELQHSEVQETPILSDSPKADRCHVLVLCQGCVCVPLLYQCRQSKRITLLEKGPANQPRSAKASSSGRDMGRHSQ